MNPAIRPHDPAAEFYTEERCYITELSNLPEDPDCSIARARLEPGVTAVARRSATSRRATSVPATSS